MNKWIFLILILLFASPIAFGETVFERSFGEMGYENLLVEGALETGCFETEFLYPQDIDIESDEIYPIVSIGIEIGPIQEGKIDVNAFLNEEQIAGLELKDFKCSEGKCWERLELPKDLLLEEENSLKICLGTGNSITSIMLDESSGIGLYKAADFSEEDAFVTTAEKIDLVKGEKTTIKILLHNQGSAVTNVKVEFARPLADDKNAFSVVEGNTYYTGEIGAGEEIELEYIVKPRRAVHMTLPPAIVYFENPFGETESKFGNLVELDVREPERKIEAFVVKDVENAMVGESIEMRLAVKNVGNDPLYSLSAGIESEAEISQQETEIEVLQPKETKYLNFTINSSTPGKFPIGCTITYTDVNISESKCQNSFAEFEQPEINPIIYIAVIFAIIAIVIYIYIMKTG